MKNPLSRPVASCAKKSESTRSQVISSRSEAAGAGPITSCSSIGPGSNRPSRSITAKSSKPVSSSRRERASYAFGPGISCNEIDIASEPRRWSRLNTRRRNSTLAMFQGRVMERGGSQSMDSLAVHCRRSPTIIVMPPFVAPTRIGAWPCAGAVRPSWASRGVRPVEYRTRPPAGISVRYAVLC